MKKIRLTCGLIACVLLCSYTQSTVCYASKSTNDQLNEAQNAYDNIQDKIEDTQGDLNDLNAQKSELEKTLGKLDEKLSDVGDVLNELDKLIADKKAEIEETWGRIEELAALLDEAKSSAELQYELTKAQIKYMYEQGDNLYLALIMSADSYADYINKNSYIEMMSEYQREQLIKLKEKQETLQKMQAEYEGELIKLEKEKEELEQYEEQVRKEQDRIAVLVEEASAEVAKYSDQIETAEARMLKYEKQMEAKENDIRILKARLEEEEKLTAQASEAKWRDISDVEVASNDRYLLANLIYCEAGGESYECQVAVGAVVMNRVKSTVFPDTIVGVIYQKKQFTPASSGRLALALSKNSATESCYKAADAALAGVTNVSDCLYFRTPTPKVTPRYVIGGAVFY